MASDHDPASSPGVVCAFLAFLLSPLLYENHSWGIQSCMHFVVGFFLLAVDQLFRDEASPRRLALGVAAALACLKPLALDFFDRCVSIRARRTSKSIGFVT